MNINIGQLEFIVKTFLKPIFKCVFIILDETAMGAKVGGPRTFNYPSD
jgi:hypothetical protein